MVEASEHERIIAEYDQARRAAGFVGNGLPCWGYANGWYKIGWGRYRKAQVVQMTEDLRAAQRGT